MEQSLYEYAIENELKYYIETYGCQMNEHDSEKIAGLLQAVGYQKAEQMQQADLILFNTCCVRDHAEKKVFGNIGALKPLSQQKSGLIVCSMRVHDAAGGSRKKAHANISLCKNRFWDKQYERASFYALSCGDA